MITLAGAAEEMLGKLAETQDHEPALSKATRRKLDLHREVWKEEGAEKEYVQIQNEARNEMKHLCSGADVTLDLEEEAGSLISRALENYRLCFGAHHAEFFRFEKKCIASWRAKKWIG